MHFLALLVSDNSRSLEKFEIADTVPQPPLRKISTRGLEFLFIDTCASDLTFLAALTLQI